MAIAVSDPRQIRKVSLTHVDDVEAQLRGEVLEHARNEFGYSADAFGAAGPLSKALRSLEILPLRQEEVNAYMKSKERTRKFDLGWLIMPVMLSLIPAYWLTVAHVHGNWDFAGFREDSWGFVVSVGGIMGSILTAMFAFICDWPAWEWKTEWQWFCLGKIKNAKERKLDWITKYPRYVPVHVLNSMVQIREAVPEAEFYIRELSTTVNKVQKVDPDPFLRVELGSEGYWIAVWDEREFEARQ